MSGWNGPETVVIGHHTRKTPVAVQAGARTQLVGVVAAGLLIVFMLLAPGLPAYLPSSTLTAIVVVSAASLVDVKTLVRLVLPNGGKCGQGLSKNARRVGVSASVPVRYTGEHAVTQIPTGVGRVNGWGSLAEAMLTSL